MSARYRLTVIHSVPDYERWKAVIFAGRREMAPGVVRMSVFRSLDDPNEVMVDLEFESADAARQLLPSLDLRELLDRTGIEVYPPVFIGERVDELSNGAGVR